VLVQASQNKTNQNKPNKLCSLASRTWQPR
jgi:hypothetical protein